MSRANDLADFAQAIFNGDYDSTGGGDTEGAALLWQIAALLGATNLPAHVREQPEIYMAPVVTQLQCLHPDLQRGDPFDTYHRYDPDVTTVSWRGGDRFAVLHGPGWSIPTFWIEERQAWEMRPQEPSRKWLTSAYYDLDTAIDLAIRCEARRLEARP